MISLKRNKIFKTIGDNIVLYYISYANYILLYSMFGNESVLSFTPSEGGGQSRGPCRVVLHGTCEGDPCFQGLLLWEEEHAEEIRFPAVVVRHLETLWVHQPV